jgi:hypothetical protein
MLDKRISLYTYAQQILNYSAKRRKFNYESGIFKFVISVRGSHCDYAPGAKTLASLRSAINPARFKSRMSQRNQVMC